MDLDNLRSRYRGSTADTYENRRQDRGKWQREHDAVANYLELITDEVTDPVVVDVPVGTGRFFELYQRLGVEAVGIDVSEDMLEQARKKLDEDVSNISLKEGDIMNLSSLSIYPDVVVCIRFMNWLDSPAVKEALSSIVEVDPRYVVVGIRVQNSAFKRFAGRLRRLYHRVSGGRNSKTTIHDERVIREYFSKCGFTIKDRELVDEWLFGDKFIYCLTTNS